MRDFVRKQKGTSIETNQKEGHDGVDKLDSLPAMAPEPPPCSLHLTRARLREHLYLERSGLELRGDNQKLRLHILKCEACRRRVIEIESAEPSLRVERTLPVIAVETVWKQPDAEVRKEALAAEISRTLAAALASPAKPFSIEDLVKMDSGIREISESNTERRKMIAAEVANACDLRWRRIQPVPEVKAAIEAAAEELYTRIRGFNSTREEQNLPIMLKQLGTGKDTQETFLLYMMTKVWFLNPESDSTWKKLEDGRVCFRLDALKHALEDELESMGTEQTRRPHG